MEFKGNIPPADKMDELLRQYMLERNPKGPGGESLMEVASGNTPVVPVDAARETQMLARLKDAVGNPVPAAAGISAGVKVALFAGITGVALVSTVLLMYFRPFSTNSVSENRNTVITLAENDVQTEPDNGTQSAVVPLNDGPVSTSSVEGEIQKQQGNQRVSTVNPKLPVTVSDSRNQDLQGVNSTETPAAVNATQESGGSSSIGALNPSNFYIGPVFSALALAPDLQQLDGTHDVMHRTKNGTVLFIPKGAFLLPNGKPVPGMYDLQIREALKPSDLIRENLAAGADVNPLYAAGGLELHAIYKGQELKLAPGAKIDVQLARTRVRNLGSMDIYTATPQENGIVTFEAEQGRQGAMIPMNPDVLYFEQMDCDDDLDVHWNEFFKFKHGLHILDPVYKNTWVWTVEFRDRMEELADKEKGHPIELVKLYLSNTSKDLWKVDKMVADAIRNGFKGYHRGYVELDADVFDQFAAQRKTQPEKFELPRDVSEDAVDPYSELLRAGVSESEAKRLSRIIAFRKMYKADMDRVALKANGKSYRKLGEIPFDPPQATFSLSQTGWNLVAKEDIKTASSLVVNVEGIEPEYVRTYLVVSSRNEVSVASADAGKFFFSVPDADVKIVAIGYKKGVTYAGQMREFKPARQTERTIVLTPVKDAELKSILTAVD